MAAEGAISKIYRFRRHLRAAAFITHCVASVPASSTTSSCPPTLVDGEAVEKSAVGKLVCETPSLATAASRLQAAHSALAETLSPEGRAALDGSQDAWRLARDERCGPLPYGNQLDCLAGAIDRRTALLEGKGPDSLPNAPTLVPVAAPDPRGGNRWILFPRLTAANRHGESGFNEAVWRLLVGAALDGAKPPRSAAAATAPSPQAEFYTLNYVGPRVIGVTASRQAVGAPAVRVSMIYDLDRGRVLSLSDILAKPAESLPLIAAICRRRLKVQADLEGWAYNGADLEPVIAAVSNWAVDRQGIAILFDPMVVAAPPDRPHECRLAYGEFGGWLLNGALLPPF